MPNPVSIVNFGFLRDLLEYFQVVRPDDLGDIVPFHAEDGREVEILKVPISEATGVNHAVQKWNEQFHRAPWWEKDHTDQLPWFLL